MDSVLVAQSAESGIVVHGSGAGGGNKLVLVVAMLVINSLSSCGRD